ncbi:MAG: hypothetical protein JW716_01790 [Candidatus Aenigmarchaeota archaeon]|nr:hypothetical protein [Candidatus Aenigmarchaeota archaeon]
MDIKKIYLDTNVFYNFLLKEVDEGFKKSEHVDQKCKTNKIAFKIESDISTVIPIREKNLVYCVKIKKDSRIDKLLKIKRENCVVYYSSSMVMAEIFRKLQKEKNFPVRKIAYLWGGLDHILGLKIIENNNVDLKHLTVLSMNFPLKKNVQDLLHIILAKKNKCLFVTCDDLDGNMDDIKKHYYKDIMKFNDFSDKYIRKKE